MTMKIIEPENLAALSAFAIRECRKDPELVALDPMELATVLRTAADACTELAAHNVALINLANILKGPR